MKHLRWWWGAACAVALNGAFGTHAAAVDRGTPVNTRPEIGRFWRSLNGQPQWSCTATLVTPHFVLTAAHCIGYSTESPEQYFFGVESGRGLMRYTVAEIFNFGPPRYWGYVPSEDQLNAVPLSPAPSGRGNNDVALVRLAASVPSDVAVPSGVAAWYIDAGSTVSLFGYGHGRCHGTQPQGDGVKRVGSWTYQVKGRENAQYLSPSGIVCSGDSGGPGVLGAPGDNGVIWGVASTSSSSWDTYGDVVYFRPWMDDIVRRAPSPPFRRDRCTNDPWVWWEPRCPWLNDINRLR